MTVPPSPLLDVPGAVPAPGQDAGVAWHYGDPVSEQIALAGGSAAVDLSHRGVLRLTGPDRLSWLHSLTTQDLVDLPPDHPVETLLLSPQGHIEYALHVVDDGAATWITLEPGCAVPVAAWLESMRFHLDVRVEDVTTDWAVVGEVVGGPVAPAGPPAWDDPWPRVGPQTRRYTAPDGPDDDPDHPGHALAWREVLVERRTSAARGTMVGAWAGTWAAQALRVAAWRPRQGAETDHRTVPHELDWLRTAVHLHKGCYRGQETVAKICNRGRPPRRLALLHMDGSDNLFPQASAPVLYDGKTVGRVTSPALHAELGPIALALLSSSTPLATDLLVEVEQGGVVAAAQEPIVCP